MSGQDLITSLRAIFGDTFDTDNFVEEVSYKPALTTADLRKSFCDSDSGIEKAKEKAVIFSTVVTIAGTDFNKIKTRSPAHIRPVIDLCVEFHKAVSLLHPGKVIGKGKLAAATPVAELKAAAVVFNRRDPSFYWKLPLAHFVDTPEGVTLPSGRTKGFELFLDSNNEFVRIISGGRVSNHARAAESILRVIFDDTQRKLESARVRP